jgi:hypothetical protein
MPLCQFYINPSNNASDFIVPVSGKANVRVISVQYYNTNSSSAHYVVQIRSDVLRFQASSLPYLTFFSGTGSPSIGFDSSHREYSINGLNLQGKIQLEVVDLATGAQPTHFGGCLLTLEIENLGVGF